MIVDDNESVRRGIRTLLESEDSWSICGEAVDGLDAVEKVAQLHPDVVLMDISMPRMDGLEATRIVRRESPQTQVIVVTQNDPGVARRQAAEADARGFVTKTNLAEDLIAQLASIADEHKSDLRSSSPAAPASSFGDLFGHGTRMGELMRSKDWSHTPTGNPDSWSPSLRMMVRFLLSNRFPQLLWWGPQFCCLYNDAYIPILGAKHPWALGQPTAEVWSEIWDVLKPLIETPFQGGPPTWIEDIPLEINRRGFVEETHFTVAYSSVPDDTVPGGIGGVLATVHEITEKVIGERRGALLRDLGARSAEPNTADEACTVVAQILERHKKDISFALLYLIDSEYKDAYLAASAGVREAVDAPFRKVSLNHSNGPEIWPFAAVVKTEDLEIVRDLPPGFADTACAAKSAAILPIRSNVPHQLAGFLVAGLNPNIQFDEAHRNFLNLVLAQISITIANASAFAEERRRAEALAEIDRAKTVFFSNVSHEFRTPLTLMLGPLHDMLSREQSQLSPGTKEQLELMNRNGARLLRLVNTLLDFSRIEAGRVNAVFQPTDLAAFTRDLASVFRSATERAGLKLVVNCEPARGLAYIDRDMWEKIVLNLISNAFKFTFEGEIVVALRQVDHQVELSVRDTGVGIPPAEIPHLFDRFHRVPNVRSRTHEGTGIGLALVNELVELHGGTMRVESEPGKGSAFFVTIPLGQDHLSSAQVEAERPLASTAAAPNSFVEEALRWLPDGVAAEAHGPSLGDELLSTQRDAVPSADGASRPYLIIADDNADMRHYLSHLLAEDYEVKTVADGEAALEAIREHRPELVLSDVMMPKLDGFGLLRELRSNPLTSTLPVILLSARAGEESRIEGLGAGADDYLVKPFSARELLSRVQTHLTLARVRDEANKLVRENEERLRAFIAASSDVIYRMSPDWSVMLQLQGKDFIADTSKSNMNWLRDYILPEDQPRVMAAVREAIRAKGAFELEHRVLRADGSIGWMFSRAIPVLDERGEIVEWFGTASDATARKNAEEGLQQAQATLELRVQQRTIELERAQRDLRNLSGKLLQVQDEERRRIARDLHDSAGQTLTVLGISLAQLSKLAKAGADAKLIAKAVEMQDQVRKLSQEVRTTSYLLHPPLLDESGIAAALSGYVEGLAARSNLKIDLHIGEDFGRLSHEMELAIFRIVQECLTNIIRHSQSDRAEIEISRDPQLVILKVVDHGRGISNERLAAIREGASGVGMQGMRERARLLGGGMTIDSNDAGTAILITFPAAEGISVPAEAASAQITSARPPGEGRLHRRANAGN